MKKVIIAFFTLLGIIACSKNSPTGLRTEFQDGDVLVEPGSAPRMSWINSCEQTAYQIIVSSKS
ncbi:MAG: hypothetical protein IJJ96_03870, partial [Bacteroidales bacterium]|nr:hypothetical protein [Bacteroidales bacterium]